MKKFRCDHSEVNLYTLDHEEGAKSTLSQRKALLRKEMREYYLLNASHLKGTLAPFLLEVEQRLDVILVRMLLARSLRESRQWISHHHVLLQDQLITYPGKKLLPGDKIEVRRSPSLSSPLWREFKAVPSYLEVDYQLSQGIYLRPPLLEELPLPFQLDGFTQMR